MRPADSERAATPVEEYLSVLTMREVVARHQVSTKTVQLAMRQMGATSGTPGERTGHPERIKRRSGGHETTRR